MLLSDHLQGEALSPILDPEHLQGEALSPIPNTLLGEALSQRSLSPQPYTSPIPNTPLGEL